MEIGGFLGLFLVKASSQYGENFPFYKDISRMLNFDRFLFFKRLAHFMIVF